MSGTSDEFWNFSVAIYGNPSVAEACLWMQDECGIDVNMLLLCCWYGRVHGEFGPAQFQQALDFSSKWSTAVVRPLRTVRRWMKATGCSGPHVPVGECMELREQVKAVELGAERMQQQVLATLVGPANTGFRPVAKQLADTAANLHAYFDRKQVTIDDRVMPRLVAVLVAAIDGANETSGEAAIRESGPSVPRLTAHHGEEKR